PPLDLRLQRHVGLKRLGGVPVRLVRLQARGSEVHACQDGGTGVVALELPDLPLAGEHPQRVTDLGLQRAVEVQRARAALEAVPERDARCGPRRQLVQDVLDDVLLLTHWSLLPAQRTPDYSRRG